jgi:Tfp pilus assembly ATPase PilU
MNVARVELEHHVLGGEVAVHLLHNRQVVVDLLHHPQRVRNVRLHRVGEDGVEAVLQRLAQLLAKGKVVALDALRRPPAVRPLLQLDDLALRETRNNK